MIDVSEYRSVIVVDATARVPSSLTSEHQLVGVSPTHKVYGIRLRYEYHTYIGDNYTPDADEEVVATHFQYDPCRENFGTTVYVIRRQL